MRNLVDIALAKPEEIRGLRYKVLWPHLNGPSECVIEPDTAETTFHISAKLAGKVVGIVTLIIDIHDEFESKNQYRLRAMATDPEYRGYGIGARLVDKAIEELNKRKVELIWCDARLIATGFYEKLGFKMKGQVYQVPNIGPHKLMYKEL